MAAKKGLQKSLDKMADSREFNKTLVKFKKTFTEVQQTLEGKNKKKKK